MTLKVNVITTQVSIMFPTRSFVGGITRRSMRTTPEQKYHPGFTGFYSCNQFTRTAPTEIYRFQDRAADRILAFIKA